MKRIKEEAEKMIEDFAKSHLMVLRKYKIKIPYTEDSLYHVGRMMALDTVRRNLKKYKLRKKRIEGFGYEWQLQELIMKEKQIQAYLRTQVSFKPSDYPKEF